MNLKDYMIEQEKKELHEKAKKSCEAKRWKIDEIDMFRTEYQRDIGRILFSDAFRRLRMKTQVFVASGLDQHNRTRMTHSLEVSQFAKTIGKALKLNVDLIEAIALGHDLGHTPYGHAGEKALNDCMKNSGKGSFNHNAQSVWILRRTLIGRKDINGEYYPGFNLTFDVVEGIWKHTDIEPSINEFDDLKMLRPTDQKGFLEAQIVNLSDGIAYIRHDIEDAVRENIITYEDYKTEVWDKYFDMEFNTHTWNYGFIHDLISNNVTLEQIEFSEHFKEAFKATKKFIYNNVILSEQVKASDDMGYEKTTTIFNYCVKNPQYLLSKYGDVNAYKIQNYGIERAAVDFIQWCGDELANEVYNSVKGK